MQIDFHGSHKIIMHSQPIKAQTATIKYTGSAGSLVTWALFIEEVTESQFIPN